MNVYLLNGGEEYFACNTYIAEKDGSGVVIDAGLDAEEILSFAKERNIKLSGVILTHAHFDHIRGCAELIEKGLPVYLNKDDERLIHGDGKVGYARDFTPTHLFSDGDKLKFGDLEFTVMQTSGHTEGSCCFFTDGYCFSGDTLFADGYGRTDLPSGNFAELKNSLRKLLNIKGKYKLMPGHGDFGEIGR